MCGRYALALRPSEIRHELEMWGLPVDDLPEDDATRQSYNVAPGYYEPVYRADVPDWGAGGRNHDARDADVKGAANGTQEAEDQTGQESSQKEVKYKLQSMKWGLVPFWTKRNPDYGSMLKTINCRDDSLMENRGMWNTMKQKKRCIVICQGFYEWLKKNGGKEKIPHFVRRKDNRLMCFAGLWDCAQFEGSADKLYTYTIITTDSNEQLKFLHDRMPVMLEPGSEAMHVWLDPDRCTWSAELQSLLKPYKGELEVYPVSKDVGKVGNNSPTFIVPITSSDNKNNIANFFSNPKGTTAKMQGKKDGLEAEMASASMDVKAAEKNADEDRITVKHEGTENNAPMPVPKHEDRPETAKRELEEDQDDRSDDSPRKKARKHVDADTKHETSPNKLAVPSGRRTRSATSNGTASKTRSSLPAPGRGSQKITSFFGK